MTDRTSNERVWCPDGLGECDRGCIDECSRARERDGLVAPRASKPSDVNAALAGATALKPHARNFNEHALCMLADEIERLRAELLIVTKDRDTLLETFGTTPKAVAARIMEQRRPVETDDRRSFQVRVGDWMLQCFGEKIARDVTERNHRFLEESLELVQAMGCTRGEADQLVEYVYGRPEGRPSQEIGGVLVTLAALCTAGNVDMAGCGELELTRIWTKIEQIRAKQAGKPKHSPLPCATVETDCEHWWVPIPSDKGPSVRKCAKCGTLNGTV